MHKTASIVQLLSGRIDIDRDGQTAFQREIGHICGDQKCVTFQTLGIDLFTTTMSPHNAYRKKCKEN